MSNNPPIKIGLIGCGRIANLVHIHNLTSIPDLDLVAAADTDEKALDALRKKKSDIRTFFAYRDLISQEDIDAVVVCLPNHLHTQAAIFALENKKHVYLEKPIANDLMDAAKLLKLWESTRVVGMIGFNYRYHNLYQKTRKLIKNNEFGQIIGVRTIFSSFQEEIPDWKKNLQTGGGVLLDLAMHHIDLIRYIFNEEIVGVYADVTSKKSDQDNAFVLFRLASGIQIESFFSFNSVDEDRFEVYGIEKKLVIDRHYSLDIEIEDRNISRSPFGRILKIFKTILKNPHAGNKIVAPRSEPSYRTAMMDFVHNIRNYKSDYPDLKDGYQALAIVNACQQSTMQSCMVSPTESK